jgi:beta-mannanase
MIARGWRLRTLQCGLAASVLLALPACAADGQAHLTAFHPLSAAHQAGSINKAALLHPKRKYYGIFTPTAPARMDSINTITKETGKQPNLDLYFQSWGAGAASGTANFRKKTAENACAQGMLPLYTWESWDTADKDSHGVVHWAQPAFSPRKIANGVYDDYIRASAKAIGSLSCPLAIRFDQEFNGYWYPWGLATDGMRGTQARRAANYIAMWRHVWRIFHHQGASNVIWVWSPNIQSKKHPRYPDLSVSYPGDKFVDWVSIDGYYYSQTDDNQHFADVFGPTMSQLDSVVPHKPRFIGETGVMSGSHKPAQITNLINRVAKADKLNGFVYFNQFKPYDRSDWRFDAPGDTASKNAFADAISNPKFANGKPGSL